MHPSIRTTRPSAGDARGRAALRSAAACLVAALLACSGGGGGTGPDDTTPPAAPVRGLLTALAPQSGSTTIRGAAGAVEPRADVEVTNLRTAARVRVDGVPDGSFVAAIAAQLGDEIDVVAIDAAGNASAATRVSAGPPVSSLTLRAVGPEQTGVQGRPLTELLRVAVEGPAGEAVRGIEVRFEVRSGGGTLGRGTAVTGSDGVASVGYSLGAAIGRNEVVARLSLDAGREALLVAQAVGPPAVIGVSPGTAQPEETVTISGANFSPVAAHNVVRFGEEPATVLEATPTTIRATVPSFASAGPVSVTLTGIASNSIAFTVVPAPVVAPPVGDVARVTLDRGDGDVRLAFESAATEYVLVLQSLTQNGASTSTTLRGGAGVGLAAGRGVVPAAASVEPAEGRIRASEREWIERARGLPRATPGRALAPADEVGSQRQFFAAASGSTGSCSDFTRVTATLRYAGAHGLVYVDDRAAAAVSADKVQALGERFDEEFYETTRAAFGPESDIDGNARVYILLTPNVNGLTTQEDVDLGRGRVTGFFFGGDLLPTPLLPCLNGIEVFYAAVPDPARTFGPARFTQEEYVDLMSSVLAHEFQHMINANHHILVGNGQSETLWLDEALSHYAETLNGIHFNNHQRAALFLDGPGETTLTGEGNALDERGASWLFVQRLVDRHGIGVLRRLVVDAGAARIRGVVNVEAATNGVFSNLFHEWAAALWLDGPGTTNDDAFEFPTLSLAGFFADVAPGLGNLITGPFLNPTDLRAPVGAGTLAVAQKGTSPVYVHVTAPGRGNARVRIDGTTSGNLQVTVLRVR